MNVVCKVYGKIYENHFGMYWIIYVQNESRNWVRSSKIMNLMVNMTFIVKQNILYEGDIINWMPKALVMKKIRPLI